MLIFCGADTKRHIDHTYSALDETRAFLRYVKYIGYLDEHTLSNAIVLLHKTESVHFGILQPRRSLIEAIPQLKTALWCVYIDSERDPFVIKNLQAVGEVYGLTGREQVFVDRQKNNYLLLRSDCASYEVLRENARQIRRTTGAYSGGLKPDSAQIPNESYPTQKILSPGLIPIIKRRSTTTTDTSYRYRSDFPSRPGRGND